MKVQNSPANVSGLDAARVDKVDLKSKKKAGAGTNAEELASAAKVDLSPRAQEMKKIKELAMAAPDVDVNKVAKFQKLIDEGKYKVDAKAVADRMVDEHLMLGE
jgi:negative regulator of flagellin synthesis FlgM